MVGAGLVEGQNPRAAEKFAAKTKIALCSFARLFRQVG